MNKTALTILAVLALASCACGPKQDIPKPDPGTTTPETPETPPENFEVQVPLKSEITHVQPMTGLVLWTSSRSKAD